MTSSINPNTIDTAYPVAGQDNSTQGFRDNFAAIKQNFEYAEEEITSLQEVVAVVNGDNGFGDNLIYAARIKDIAVVKATYPSASGALNLSFAAASYYSLITAGSVNLTFSDWPTGANVGVIRVQIRITDVLHTITIAADNTQGAGLLIDVAGIQGYTAINAYSGVIAFAAEGYYEFDFVSSSGDAVTVKQLNQSLIPFNASSQELTAGSAASLAVTTNYFSTSTAETATLAAGVNGQIKVFVMTGWAGNMVITVTNAGWGGAGTMTFSAAGQSATLLYTDNSWFCIANNGTTFA
jgi:hypothetical protein